MKKPDQHIIQKVFASTATNEEIKLVISWFATPDGQAYLDADMYRRANEYSTMDIISCTESNANNKAEVWLKIKSKIPELSSVKPDRKRITVPIRVFISYAATIILLLSSILSVSKLSKNVDIFGNEEYKSLYIPKGERSVVILQDGSTIYLGPDSHLEYPRKFGLNQRRVLLDGEAYFDISSDHDRPFHVETGQFEIKVTGTSFNVMAHHDDSLVLVRLDRGKVSVGTKQNGCFSQLQPGDISSFNRHTDELSIVHADSGIQQINDWKMDLLDFNNTSIQQILSTLSRRFAVEFQITDQKVRYYTYTFQTECHDLNSILDILESLTPIQFKRKGDQICVSMK